MFTVGFANAKQVLLCESYLVEVGEHERMNWITSTHRTDMITFHANVGFHFYCIWYVNASTLYSSFLAFKTHRLRPPTHTILQDLQWKWTHTSRDHGFFVHLEWIQWLFVLSGPLSFWTAIEPFCHTCQHWICATNLVNFNHILVGCGVVLLFCWPCVRSMKFL